MKIETTKMSSRGQIVIPQNIREQIDVDEGTIFLVMTSSDTIILKKIKTPSKEDILKDIKNISKKGRINADSLGIKESDVSKILHKRRGVNGE